MYIVLHIEPGALRSNWFLKLMNILKVRNKEIAAELTISYGTYRVKPMFLF